ncbi:insulin-like growth factor 3 isoform X1 [Amphiprion ocellaris]|uniref:insulin-like growth factor 3 isoform X1 n=1 Tax=Amphiprion ocellaris TaxID=80972 RepID=UPI0024112CF8|nr:insulin-like growth factor 3 isoform X1 [Amphiprion ocellaris]
MDLLNKLEIYIPVEAEVKYISLQSLPNSMLRRMGLPLSDPDISRKLAESPKGIWISPAVLQRRGQKLTSHTGDGVMENTHSAMATKFWVNSGPLRMSIVSPNHTAYEVLKDTMPGTRRSPTLLLHQGSVLQTNRDAVVIYRGSVYLFIKKPSRSQGQAERLKQPASMSAIPLTSNLSSKSQKKELLNDKRPKKKHTTCKVTHREYKTDVIQKNRDMSTSKTMCPVPLPTDGVYKMDSQSYKDATGEKAFNSQGEQEELVSSLGVGCEMQELGDEEAESTGQNGDMSSTIQMDNGEVDPSSSQSRTRRDSLGAAASSSSGHMECVFNELAQAEEIARVKAKFSSALNNLPLSK